LRYDFSIFYGKDGKDVKYFFHFVHKLFFSLWEFFPKKDEAISIFA
jgi:hypothetical protein